MSNNILSKKDGISQDMEKQKVDKIQSESEMEQILKKIRDIDREISRQENMLKQIDRNEKEPPICLETVPDYKELGTFRVDKMFLESDFLENKESSDFDFGIISKAIYVM